MTHLYNRGLVTVDLGQFWKSMCATDGSAPLDYVATDHRRVRVRCTDEHRRSTLDISGLLVTDFSTMAIAEVDNERALYAAVHADWLEEQGFTAAAQALRKFVQ